MKHYCRRVKVIGYKKSIEIISTSSGEGFEFSNQKTLKSLITAQNINKVAKNRGLEISSKIHGATLIKSPIIVTASIKIIYKIQYFL